MIKTLTVTIKDANQEEDISIRGTRNENEFNKTIVLVFGTAQVAVDSKVLANALKEVVDFQTSNSKLGYFIAQGLELGNINDVGQIYEE